MVAGTLGLCCASARQIATGEPPGGVGSHTAPWHQTHIPHGPGVPAPTPAPSTQTRCKEICMRGQKLQQKKFKFWQNFTIIISAIPSHCSFCPLQLLSTPVSAARPQGFFPGHIPMVWRSNQNEFQSHKNHVQKTPNKFVQLHHWDVNCKQGPSRNRTEDLFIKSVLRTFPVKENERA